MNLSISNLSFPREEKLRAYALIAKLGAKGVEIAPTRLAGWDAMTVETFAEEASILDDFGLRASSLQAIVFDKPQLELLGAEESFNELCAHIRRISEIAMTLGCSVAVFGAPKNRQRNGLTEDVAVGYAIDRFARLGELCAENGLIIGIEPVPAFYGCDFILNAETATRIVRKVNSPNIRLHLDTGCALLGSDDIADAIAQGSDVLAHFHIAEPKLAEFNEPKAEHDRAASSLALMGYNKWLAIEMFQAPDWRRAVTSAIQFSLRTYDVPRQRQ
ncbi:sugar phosphate isomerase/epimerase family protein [Rhizobium terrae]|uniref:sugar phosphate isomerase/epimerase family protein n=1 Tax=Rhizobium terrae TaxID=2171756 RepID=UPI000E3E3631|nr:sugar phosphate isomerase/epimerase [Rhizobium terrae]